MPISAELRHRSPPLVVVALVFVLFCVASLITNVVFANSLPVPSTYPPIDALEQYYTGQPGVVRLAAFLQFAASIPLAVLVASLVSRLLFLRINVAGVHIALVGGIVATVFLAFPALAVWALSHPGLDPATLRVVHQLAFAGDAAHAGGLGLLLAGLSMPALAFRLLPAWLCWLGLGAAIVAELSVFALILPVLVVLLPLAHILSWIWLIAAGALLPDRAAA
jgi:hypothetical protein